MSLKKEVYRIVYLNGMVNVDSEDISFAILPDMYEGNVPGVGIQVEEHVDKERAERMCMKISEAVLEYHDGAEHA